jgi:hypothetical protein
MCVFFLLSTCFNRNTPWYTKMPIIKSHKILVTHRKCSYRKVKMNYFDAFLFEIGSDLNLQWTQTHRRYFNRSKKPKRIFIILI